MPLIAFDNRILPEPEAFHSPEEAPAQGPLALDVPNTAEPAALALLLSRAVLIRIPFPGFADGRGFSLGFGLRELGYTGRLRAVGSLIPDQRVHLAACGFDEVELAPELLARQGGAEVWSHEAATPPYRLRRRIGNKARTARVSAA